MEIQTLFNIKTITDIYNNLTVIACIGLAVYLIMKLFSETKIIKGEYQFRLNSETVYSIIKILGEGIYALSVASSVVAVIVNIKLSTSVENYINDITSHNHFLTIAGMVILIVVSVVYRMFFSGRSRMMNIIDGLILLIAFLLMVSGIISGSVTNFNYIIN